MGKTRKLSEMSTEEILHHLHNTIELHMMQGLTLAKLLDNRDLYRETKVWAVPEPDLERRIQNVVDVRNSMKSDIHTMKTHLIVSISKLCDAHIADFEVLESNL